MNPATRHLATIVLGAAGVFAASRGASYVLHLANTQRHHVESAWFVLAGAVLCVALLRFQRPQEAPRRAITVSRLAWLPLWWLGAMALYFPVANAGLFSDDFVLLDHARDADFVSPDLAFVRPLLLALWWVVGSVLPAGAVDEGLHALNIVFHGTNAFLLTRFAGRLGIGGRESAAIGALFLTFPLNVEAVTWPSAVCDVLLLTEFFIAAECLSAAGHSGRLVFRHDGRRASMERRRTWAACGVVALSVAGLLTKETGIIVGPALVLLLLLSPQYATRANVVAVCASSVTALGYAAMRVYWGVPDSHTTMPSGYALKELLVRPFATLGLPFHDALVSSLAYVSAVIAVGLAAGVAVSARRWHRHSRDFRLVVVCCLWISLSVLPVFTAFYVSPDLQGSRYLYVGSAFWSLMIYVLARDTLKADSWAGAMCLVLAVGSIGIVREHQQTWRQAAALRELVLQELDRASAPCSTVQAAGVPDSVAGAFVFRNGFAEAVADRIPRLTVIQDGAPPGCSFVWNGSSFTGR